MTSSGRLEVGWIVKAHGLSGEVAVRPITNVDARFAVGSVLFDGERELRVESSRRHRDGWLVKFGGIDDRSAAERLRRTTLTAEADGQAPDEGFWVHDLVGASVTDPSGELIGTVDAVQVNPAHDLLVLDTGELVPVVFIAEVAPGHVVIDAPEGLVDRSRSES